MLDIIRMMREWIQYKMKLGDYPFYCTKCQGCGYIECCPAKQCRGGLFCFGYYTPEELDGTVQSERYPDENE